MLLGFYPQGGAQPQQPPAGSTPVQSGPMFTDEVSEEFDFEKITLCSVTSRFFIYKNLTPTFRVYTAYSLTAAFSRRTCFLVNKTFLFQWVKLIWML